MARRASAARVKANRSYTVEEAAEVTGVTAQTVRQWIKRGLPALKEERPFLILGHVLRDFLKRAEQDRRRPLGPGELYCLHCKSSTTPALGMIDYQPISETSGQIMAFCTYCEGECRRMIRRSDLERWQQAGPVAGKGGSDAYRGPGGSVETITSDGEQIDAQGE